MAHLKPAPITLSAGEGSNVSVAGYTYSILASGKHTGSALATIDMLIPQVCCWCFAP